MMKWFESFVMIVVVSVTVGFGFTLVFGFWDAHVKMKLDKRRVKRVKKLIK